MNVNSDVLAALLTTYQARFGADFNKSLETQEWREIAQVVESTTLNETVPFSGAAPRVQDTTDGTVQYEDASTYSISISNRVFQAGWSIQREAWADDRVGLFANKPSEMAEAAAEHPGEYMWGLIENNGLAYDGVAFYSASHLASGLGAAVNNIQSGTGVDPVDLLYDLNLSQIKMFNFLTDKNRKLKRFGNVITTPVDLYQTWFEALAVLNVNDSGAPTRVFPGGTSFTAGDYRVIVNPEATDANNWQLHHVSGNRKPFVLTWREAPRLEGTQTTNCYEWTEERMAKYSTYARYGRGYGDPRLSVLVTN